MKLRAVDVETNGIVGLNVVYKIFGIKNVQLL
jgi:hypothetical protein